MLKLVELTKKNFGEKCNKEDFLDESYFELDYEGYGKFYEVRNLSGKSEVKNFRFNMFELVHIVSILDREVPFKDYKSACDGEVWVIKYYDRKGKLLKVFEGYMYGKRLEEIFNALYLKVKE